MTKIPVGVLGATGTVGQTFLQRLAAHPLFEVVMVAGSPERAGQRYGDTVHWRGNAPLDPAIAQLTCRTATPSEDVRLVFSALDTAIAREVEPAFATAGSLVVSNASAFRMADDVPLVIPEVNADHLALLEQQRAQRGWAGGIIANPNCATAVLALALAPLHRAFGLRQVTVATLQAVSGAGYPGVPSLDILDNVIPFIATEEEKIAEETCRLLGTLTPEGVTGAKLEVSAMVHRVPVLDGHMVSASASFNRAPTPAEATAVLRAFRGADPVPSLPSSPEAPIRVDDRSDRPQTRLDRDHGGGMSVTVGRIRPCPVGDLRFTALGHNLIRGAAGAAIQNAELAVAMGVLG
jgi:aspartate-semialdehyde dehydrogenase